MKLTIIPFLTASLLTTSITYTAEAEKKLQQENAKYALWMKARETVNLFYYTQDQWWSSYYKIRALIARSQALALLEKNPDLTQQDALAYAPSLDQMQNDYKHCINQGNTPNHCFREVAINSITKQVLQDGALAFKTRYFWKYLTKAMVPEDPDQLLN
jgi:hypothetical protein